MSGSVLILATVWCGCDTRQPEKWTAVYVAEVIYRDPGDNSGYLYQIGDTLISEEEISSENARDILDSARPSYNIEAGRPNRSARLQHGKDQYRRYRYFIVRSGDSAEDIVRNSSIPSFREMLPEQVREASDLLIRNYNADSDSLNRKWFRDNLDEIMENMEPEI